VVQLILGIYNRIPYGTQYTSLLGYYHTDKRVFIMSRSVHPVDVLSNATKPEARVPDVEEHTSNGTAQQHSGFPKLDGRSLSHWLQIAQGDPLLNHRTTPVLPPTADFVIIGSGVSILPQAIKPRDSWLKAPSIAIRNIDRKALPCNLAG
jgi:hypothetical protein